MQQNEDLQDLREPTIQLPIDDDPVIESASMRFPFDTQELDALRLEHDSFSSELSEKIDRSVASGEDPRARQLHREAYDLYRKANTEYMSSGGTFEFITLESGKRSVSDQVKLYRKYVEYRECNGPKVPAANHPGKSLHNFGMAVDVVRGSDETRLATALVNNGWIAAVDGEGWHFEASGAPSYTSVQRYIQTELISLAQTIADSIVNAILYTCYLLENEAEFRRQEADIRNKEVAINRARTELRTRRAQLNQEATQLNNEANSIVQEESAIRSLSNQLNGMVYNRCPNGQPYVDCTHASLKQQWDSERQAIADEIRRRTSAVGQRKAR
jgi:hypothetical protein